MTARKQSKLKTGPWSKDDVKQLRASFGSNNTADVANELNRPYDATKKKASRLGLRKTVAYLKTLGRKR